MLEQMVENPNAGALSFLMEMELVQSPALINAIVLNVFRLVKGLKDSQFIVDQREKKLLVYIELNWWYQRFRQKRTVSEVKELLDQALPGFTKRVITDKALFEKALRIVERR